MHDFVAAVAGSCDCANNLGDFCAIPRFRCGHCRIMFFSLGKTWENSVISLQRIQTQRIDISCALPLLLPVHANDKDIFEN